MRSRMLAMAAVLALLMTGCGGTAGTSSPVSNILPAIVTGGPAKEQASLEKAFGPVEQKLPAGQDLVAVAPARDGARLMAFLAKGKDGWEVRGQRQTVPADAEVKLDGNLVVVQSLKEGAPQYAAYTVTAGGLEAAHYYALKAPEPTVRTGHLVMVNKHLNALWHFQDGKLVRAYRVATGRQTKPPAPSWQDYKTNFFTPEGAFKVSNFVENPPFNALKPGDKSYPGGHAENPLGTRWMGFQVLDNDNAWVWGIHGTSHPELMGTWASDGCIRMLTREAEELFAQIKGKNATLLITGS